jgi:CheY-like chemotaxis protein
MIVEDIHYNSITLKHLSHSLNCECAVVANGTDAVRFYETYHDQISAILMDICLPQLNGIDATKLIRYFEKKNEIRAVPIFIVTADLDNVSKKAAFAAGANEFFEKPLHRLVLAKALQLYSPSSMKIAFVDNDRFALDMYQSLVGSEGY